MRVRPAEQKNPDTKKVQGYLFPSGLPSLNARLLALGSSSARPSHPAGTEQWFCGFRHRLQRRDRHGFTPCSVSVQTLCYQLARNSARMSREKWKTIAHARSINRAKAGWRHVRSRHKSHARTAVTMHAMTLTQRGMTSPPATALT